MPNVNNVQHTGLIDFYRVISAGVGSTPYAAGQQGLYLNGDLTPTMAFGQSWNVIVIDRTSHAITATNTYDLITGGGSVGLGNLQTYLGTLTSSSLVIIGTAVDASTNFSQLSTQLYSLGASRDVVEDSMLLYGTAYVLVGVPGRGEGTGLELISSPNNNSVETGFLLVNSELVATQPSRPTTAGVVLQGGTTLELNGISPPTPQNATLLASGTVGSGLVANAGYLYVLTAVDANNMESFNNGGVSVTQGSTAYPVQLTWLNNTSFAASINIYRNNNRIATVSGTATSYTDTGGAATSATSPLMTNSAVAYINAGLNFSDITTNNGMTLQFNPTANSLDINYS